MFSNISLILIDKLSSSQLSVWGGPLRVQATAQPPEKAKHLLRRIIHHPIQWVRGLEEWSHFSSLGQSMRAVIGEKNVATERKGRAFGPDPLLFPATWLPLRWLQIFAVAKASEMNYTLHLRINCFLAKLEFIIF